MPPLNNFPISNWNPKLPLIIQKNEFHYKVTITSHIRDGNETKYNSIISVVSRSYSFLKVRKSCTKRKQSKLK